MEIDLNELQLDVIKELMNVGVNESTNILSEMLNVEIKLNIPNVTIVKFSELPDELELLGSDKLTAVNLKFRNGFSGVSQLVFSQLSANKLVNLFSTEVVEIDELDEMKAGALVEIGNIVLNAVISEFSNFLKHEFKYFVPEFFDNYKSNYSSQMNDYSGSVVLLGHTIFEIEKFEIKGDIIIFLQIESFKNFISMIDKYLESL